jgi:hypothetical protein
VAAACWREYERKHKLEAELAGADERVIKRRCGGCHADLPTWRGGPREILLAWAIDRNRYRELWAFVVTGKGLGHCNNSQGRASIEWRHWKTNKRLPVLVRRRAWIVLWFPVTSTFPVPRPWTATEWRQKYGRHKCNQNFESSGDELHSSIIYCFCICRRNHALENRGATSFSHFFPF